MSQVTANLMLVKQRLELAALAAKREPEDIQLLAVSKTFPAIAVEEAMHAGQTAFGENYVQEGVEKIQQLAKLRPWLEWHFIGPLQSNKTRDVAEHFDWVHSIDRLKIAERLSRQRGEFPDLGDLQVCVKINVSAEESKSGIALDEVEELCTAVAKLPHLVLADSWPFPHLALMSLNSVKLSPPFGSALLGLKPSIAMILGMISLIPFRWGCRMIWRLQLLSAAPWYV